MERKAHAHFIVVALTHAHGRGEIACGAKRSALAGSIFAVEEVAAVEGIALDEEWIGGVFGKFGIWAVGSRLMVQWPNITLWIAFSVCTAVSVLTIPSFVVATFDAPQPVRAAAAMTAVAMR